ncbi:restriction endonuclease [Candidatus Shapirobacteria bacterium CG_4_8_14_3_um_filter_35_11]|uniref:Restriction endonuclease n=1 Tax=Candidatus Shapirobacteria bacterium CG_4_8_14_3_um_filter_35_11 TaxID=1974874 RepID=A0A2M8GK89_9BACT|nr:MAG: restriction endonuclease [Candidatus Shapirobacteria bacterium CG_4_8_14_3_um_filter_35_11]
MITLETKQIILEKLDHWVKFTLAKNHKSNTQKCGRLKTFKINPLLLPYLTYYLTGNLKPESIAKALIYPRVLSTSIITTFGTGLQKFITDTLVEICGGSGIQGIDIEFIDQTDGKKRYCQVKLGPNTINKDDVKTIKDHFQSAKNISRTNNIGIIHENLVVGIIYGEENEKNANLKKVEQEYEVYIGQDFWYRLTGDPKFYKKMILTISEASKNINMKRTVEKTIKSLALEIDEKKLFAV